MKPITYQLKYVTKRLLIQSPKLYLDSISAIAKQLEFNAEALHSHARISDKETAHMALQKIIERAEDFRVLLEESEQEIAALLLSAEDLLNSLNTLNKEKAIEY